MLVTFIGGLGHFEPLAPLARAAAAAGHDVAVACSGRLVAQVAASGFEVVPTSEVRGPAGAGGRDLTPLAPVGRRAAEVEFAVNFADKGARRHAVAVQAAIRDWRPDVVVRDEADFGSAIAAEVLGVPAATVLVLAAGLLVRPHLVEPRLSAVRVEHGLAADPELRMLSTGTVVSPFPRSFRSPHSPIELPESTLHVRSRTPPPRTPSSGRPRVYATLGTVFNTGSGDLLERLVAGLALLDADVLLTVGRDVDPAVLGPAPAHVRVERFVPQDDVLGATDVVVSHGGSGSLLAAMAHGLPSVLLPLGADQPHNAARAEELGIARGLDAATATPAAIAETVEATLAEAALGERVRAVADEIAASPPVEAALAALVAGARPG